jgi:hypothetical protein
VPTRRRIRVRRLTSRSIPARAPRRRGRTDSR